MRQCSDGHPACRDEAGDADARRPSRELIAAYREVARCYSASCVFSDVLARQGVLASDMKPVFSSKLVGPATTVRLSPGDLEDPLDVLDVARPGDVIVVDAAGERETAIWGGLMGMIAHARGIEGAVINGAARDVDELRDIPFPVYCRSVVPRGSHTMLSGRRHDLMLNVPVDGGGVVVSPGDMVVADNVGVTIVPFGKLVTALERAREQAAREQATREEIASGTVSVDDLLQQFGRL